MSAAWGSNKGTAVMAERAGCDNGGAGAAPPPGADLFARIASQHILCVGDVMLDVAIACHGGRRSPEAPILVFAEGEGSAQLGGAANVAANVASLGARSDLAGVIGRDAEGEQVARMLRQSGVSNDHLLVVAADRPTTRKTRYIADGQQVLRIDRESTQAAAVGLLERLRSPSKPFGAILVSDYAKGVVTAQLLEACHALGRVHSAPILVDPKGTDWERYGPVDLIKPNAAELAAMTGMACNTDKEVEQALQSALAGTEAAAIVVTRSGRGASLARRGESAVLHIPAIGVEVSDVCGAGDTNLAMLGCCLAAGESLEQAARLAQLASAIAVQQHGNACVTGAQVLDAMAQGRLARPHRTKVVGRDGLVRLLREWRAAELVVGFTNGCFDLLHPGHINTLVTARAQCDRLVVGLNSDSSVRRLKGNSRPILSAADRSQVLAALEAVDAVVVFEDDTPASLIGAVRPDVLVKGGDYHPDDLAGADFVRSYGGRVMVTGFVAGHSTTAMVKAAQCG
jgi:D-beta-D-heptose 7-phosphate kinase/D-beta-D-heptose 1-phosphate adenosyltransferase